MSKPLPKNDEPVSLRSTRELAVRPADSAPEKVSAAVVPATPPSDPQAQWLSTTTLAMSGVAVLALGWVVQRRHHLAQQVPPELVDAGSGSDRGQLAALPQPANEPLMEAPAPVAAPPHRVSVLGVAGQKRLIRLLMWVRTVTGAAAILAAIAIVVFWSIETTDRRAGETGLNIPLLLLLLAGWVAAWGSGRLADLLHRKFFGRVHPKFDD